MVWSASPTLVEAENTLCTSTEGCPALDVTFTCCDPCDPSKKCVSATSTFSIYDKNTPTISGIVDQQTDECDGDPDSQLNNWLSDARCTDGEGEVMFKNSVDGNAAFATASRCNMYATVTLECKDDCGLCTTAVYAYQNEDTQPPDVLVDPCDKEVECDGYGNAEALDEWIRSAGGMKVNDACQGMCPYPGQDAITHYREIDASSELDSNTNVNVYRASFGGTTILSAFAAYPQFAKVKTLFDKQMSLTNSLTASGPFTIFAPKNGAFEGIPYPSNFEGAKTATMFKNLKDDVSEAANVLLDHLYIGKLNFQTLYIGQTIQMVGSVTLTVETTLPQATFTASTQTYWATFQATNIIDVTNGVVVEIDRVILGSWGTWQAYDWGVTETHPGQSNDGCSNVHFDNSAVVFGACAGDANACNKCATVTFTAQDACSNSISRDGTFKIVDTEGPVITEQAQDKRYVYTGGLKDQLRFATWMQDRAGARATDLCTATEDLVWTNDKGDELLPNACNGVGNDKCECEIPVEFCVKDCLEITECTTATFSLYEKDPAPIINPVGECPGTDLYHLCDNRCGQFNQWETNAGNMMTEWLQNQACLCATDCTDVTWTYENEPTGDLCGTSGTVTFVATDETSNFATKKQTYNFPKIFDYVDYCEQQTYGCCPGTRLAKQNQAGTNCPCTSSLYGCCPNMQTPQDDAEGNHCFTEIPAPAPPPPPSRCEICSKNNKNKPSSITFLYSAGQGVSANNQGTKAYGDMTATYPTTATITMSGFSASVSDGDEFTLSGSFDAYSIFTIDGRTIAIHTSCSVDLFTFDQYGPLTITGSNSCTGPNPPPPTCVGKWGCCDGTFDPKVDGRGSNCCGVYGCCDDGSQCTDSQCSNCPCSLQRYGCCTGSQLAREDRYGETCPLDCGIYGCCPNSDVLKDDQTGSNCLPEPECIFSAVCGSAPVDPGTTPDPCSVDFGCCPGSAVMKEDLVGTNCDCQTSQFGCCPYPHNEQAASNNLKSDCPCGVFGCCTGIELKKNDADGTNCPCESTEFGCCPGTPDNRDDVGGSNCPCGTTVAAPPCPTPPPPPCVEPVAQVCVLCDKNNKNKPSSITFLYTAGQGVSANSQGTKAYGDFTATYPTTATISMSGFSATVSDGDEFTISGSFDAYSHFAIAGFSISIHTSCSVNLQTLDRFGSLTITGGSNCVQPTPCPPTPATQPMQIVADRTVAPAVTTRPKQIICPNPCTGEVFLQDCTLGSACYDYSKVACVTPATCLEQRCVSFADHAVGLAASSPFCLYGTSCPVGTATITFMDIRDTTTGDVRTRLTPTNCACCSLPKKTIACIACGNVVMVECGRNDPNCENYNSEMCVAATVGCTADVGAGTATGTGLVATVAAEPLGPSTNAGGTCTVGFDACSVTKSKFKTIELEWTGNVKGNIHNQGAYNKLSLKPKASIGRTSWKLKPVGKKWTVPAKPKVGDQFIIASEDINKKFMPGFVTFKVNGDKFRFGTNCKKAPLRIGDEFGPFKVVGFTTQKSPSTCNAISSVFRSEAAELASEEDDDDVESDSSSNNDNGVFSNATLTASVIVCIAVVLLVVAGVVLIKRQSIAADADATPSESFAPGGGYSEDEYVPTKQGARRTHGDFNQIESEEANIINGDESVDNVGHFRTNVI
jgi:uncharacterized surface protein with fasciclin (FAS1) repeats